MKKLIMTALVQSSTKTALEISIHQKHCSSVQSDYVCVAAH